MRSACSLVVAVILMVALAGCGSASQDSVSNKTEASVDDASTNEVQKIADRAAGSSTTTTDTSGNKYPLALALSGASTSSGYVIQIDVNALSDVKMVKMWFDANSNDVAGKNGDVSPLDVLQISEPSGLKAALDSSVDPQHRVWALDYGAIAGGQKVTFKVVFPSELGKSGCAAVQLWVPGQKKGESRTFCPSSGSSS